MGRAGLFSSLRWRLLMFSQPPGTNSANLSVASRTFSLATSVCWPVCDTVTELKYYKTLDKVIFHWQPLLTCVGPFHWTQNIIKQLQRTFSLATFVRYLCGPLSLNWNPWQGHFHWKTMFVDLCVLLSLNWNIYKTLDKDIFTVISIDLCGPLSLN